MSNEPKHPAIALAEKMFPQGDRNSLDALAVAGTYAAAVTLGIDPSSAPHDPEAAVAQANHTLKALWSLGYAVTPLTPRTHPLRSDLTQMGDDLLAVCKAHSHDDEPRLRLLLDVCTALGLTVDFTLQGMPK